LLQLISFAVPVRVDGPRAQRGLDLRVALALQFERQQFPAPFAQLGHGRHQPLAHFALLGRGQRIRGAIRQLHLVHRHLGVLAAPLGLAAEGHHFEPDNLQRERQEILQPFEVPVFLMQQNKDFLGQILGSVPL
jgi:hypothetical protein